MNHRHWELRGILPARSVALEVLALALQHTGSNLGRGRVVLARVGNALHISERDSRVDQLVRVGDKCIPFVILGHRNRAGPQFIHSIVRLVGLTLEDTSVRIIRFLDLAYYNRLEFTPGIFQV